MEIFVSFIVGMLIVILLLGCSCAMKRIVWFFAPLFDYSNKLQWVLYSPFRFLSKKKNSELPRRIFLISNYTLVGPIYWLFVHISLTPLRVINSLYYDVILYWSVMLDDTLLELFSPRLGAYRRLSGIAYFLRWILGFPVRLVVFFSKNIATIIDGILMLGISSLLPTFTMYHGTRFSGPAADIAQKGRWFVGSGDYAGSGIYFAIQKSVANHYASKGEDRGVLIVRFTPTFTRNQMTLDKETRQLVGSNGKKLSERLSFPWATIEHWRNDLNGWEYCLVQPGKAGRYVRSWRIRPVAVLKDETHQVARIWGGIGNYSFNPAGIFVGLCCWVMLFSFSGIVG